MSSPSLVEWLGLSSFSSGGKMNSISSSLLSSFAAPVACPFALGGEGETFLFFLGASSSLITSGSSSVPSVGAVLDLPFACREGLE